MKQDDNGLTRGGRGANGYMHAGVILTNHRGVPTWHISLDIKIRDKLMD